MPAPALATITLVAASPDVRFPSIDGLRAFEAAARLGSFERAADELAVTASAVSKRIAALEDLIGTPLFTRGPKALALTATGKEYLAQVGAALGLLAAVPLHRRTAQRLDAEGRDADGLARIHGEVDVAQNPGLMVPRFACEPLQHPCPFA